uniref:Putative reverse transcriptase-like protein n=1 Tax=viral metagenome TaxID=1070528 RepID=A0A6H1ZR64_9ZZZZ
MNVGEYQAVILALKEAKRLKLKQVMLLTDSQLTANQINGLWKCRKEHLLTLLEQARTLLKGLKGEISWISREDNLAGKVLE